MEFLVCWTAFIIQIHYFANLRNLNDTKFSWALHLSTDQYQKTQNKSCCPLYTPQVLWVDQWWDIDVQPSNNISIMDLLLTDGIVANQILLWPCSMYQCFANKITNILPFLLLYYMYFLSPIYLINTCVCCHLFWAELCQRVHTIR